VHTADLCSDNVHVTCDINWTVGLARTVRIHRTYGSIHLVISLPKIPYIHRIYMWFWPTLNRRNKGSTGSAHLKPLAQLVVHPAAGAGHPAVSFFPHSLSAVAAVMAAPTAAIQIFPKVLARRGALVPTALPTVAHLNFHAHVRGPCLLPTANHVIPSTRTNGLVAAAAVAAAAAAAAASALDASTAVFDASAAVFVVVGGGVGVVVAATPSALAAAVAVFGVVLLYYGGWACLGGVSGAAMHEGINERSAMLSGYDRQGSAEPTLPLHTSEGWGRESVMMLQKMCAHVCV